MTDTRKYFNELAEEEGPAAAHLRASHADYRASDAADLSDEREGQLTLDVYQTGDAIVIESPIAGVKGEDIDINITNESVTIRGKRERMQTVSDEDYFYQECYWGRFSRSVILPEAVDAESSDATIKNGVLRIIMPKLSLHKGKKLKVKGV